eukprot:gene7012-7797_t
MFQESPTTNNNYTSEGLETKVESNRQIMLLQNGNIYGKKAIETRLFRSRWLILFVFCLVNLSYGALWITFSSISDIAVRYYRIEPLFVDWLSMAFLLAFMIFALPSANFLSSYGLRATILLAAILNTCGTYIRFLGVDSDKFNFIAIGQICAAIAGPFVLAVPPELATVWFGDHERAIATSIGMLMNYVGVAIGFLQPTLMVPDSSDIDEVKDGIYSLVWFQAAFCSITLVLVFWFVKDRPIIPPSVSQALRDKEQHNLKLSFISSLKVLARNWNFHLTAQAYGIMFGLLTVISTLLNQIVKSEFHFVSDFQIGLMGFIGTLVGIVGILLFGFWIEKYQLYKATSIFVYSLHVLCLIAFTVFLLWMPNFTMIFVTFAVINVLAVPYTSFVLEQIAEITYPLSEFTTCTVAIVIGNIYGFVLTYVHGWMLEVGMLPTVCYCLTGLCIVGLVLVLIADVPLKRTEADHTNNKQDKPVFVAPSNESGYESTIDGNII